MARPATGTTRKKGKKNRKHGRNKRSPAMQRYNAEDRASKNKARNLARVAKKSA